MEENRNKIKKTEYMNLLMRELFKFCFIVRSLFGVKFRFKTKSTSFFKTKFFFLKSFEYRIRMRVFVLTTL